MRRIPFVEASIFPGDPIFVMVREMKMSQDTPASGKVDSEKRCWQQEERQTINNLINDGIEPHP